MYTIAVVGLGGTGCEVIRSLVYVLKELSISSAQIKLIVVDRDTVSTTNLGNQALYTSESVGEFKSSVVRTFIVNQGYKVEEYSTDAARPAFIVKLATATITFLCVDNVETRRKIIPALLLVHKTVLDVGTEGLAGSIRLYSSRYPCFYCTSWMYPKRKRPLCSVPGIPRSVEDCILIAAYQISECNINSMQTVSLEDSSESFVLARANEIGEMHNLDTQITLGDVTNTLQQVISTPFHISGLAASYAVSLWCRHFVSSACLENSIKLVGCSEDNWPKECLWMISTYNGFYVRPLTLERQQGCGCAFSLPNTEPKVLYSEIISKYIGAPDFTIVADQRIVYSHALLHKHTNTIPLEKDLEGTVFIYANGKLVYAEWMDYKLILPQHDMTNRQN